MAHGPHEKLTQINTKQHVDFLLYLNIAALISKSMFFAFAYIFTDLNTYSRKMNNLLELD